MGMCLNPSTFRENSTVVQINLACALHVTLLHDLLNEGLR